MFRATGTLFLCFLLLSLAAFAAEPPSTPIQDNSFLVEEAYNQETGVIQHVSTLTRLWNSNDWVYGFSQEWPAPHHWRHQLSYSLALQHSGAYPHSGAGFGDTFLNYRYQLVGSGESRVAFSPRVSALFATGDVNQGRSLGGAGIQVNLPLSVVVRPKFVTHWNAGATFVPNAHNAAGDSAALSGYNLGQSIVWLMKPRMNLLLETVYTNTQTIAGADRTAWSPTLYISPGVRWAFNFSSGLQVVPGVGVPIGAGPSQGNNGLLLYLSFEHPLRAFVHR